MLIVNVHSFKKWIIELALRERYISNKYFIHKFIFYKIELEFLLVKLSMMAEIL